MPGAGLQIEVFIAAAAGGIGECHTSKCGNTASGRDGDSVRPYAGG